MHPEDVLTHPATRLGDSERRSYFTNGYLALDSAISPQWITRLRDATREIVERSGAVTRNDGAYVIEDGHSAESPRLHRLMSPEAHHPVFWEFIASEEMAALAADVVGPDVKFHHAKLNFKSGRGSRGFKWHQDIPAWPHTDYSPVTIGVYIEGCGPEQGPLSMVRGSNHGALYTQYDHDGNYAVCCRDEDIGWVREDMIDAPAGGPGTVVLLHCRTIHGSRTNHSDAPRPLLLAVYSSADSFAYTSAPIDGPYRGAIVRGQPARYACFDSRPCELPPDWARAGYAGPWELQKNAESAGGD